MSTLKTSLKIGLQLLQMLAQSGPRPVPVRELAATLGQSEKYLEQLLLPLRRSRVVTSTRGPHGGYQLARPAHRITLLEVMELMQGPLTFCDCPDGRCGDCVNPAIWQALEGCIETSIEAVTLADIIAGKAAPVPKRVTLAATWVQDGLGI